MFGAVHALRSSLFAVCASHEMQSANLSTWVESRLAAKSGETPPEELR
jgi:hypothetical protein